MKESVARLHSESIVIDGMGGAAELYEVEQQGGVTAINVTIAGAFEHNPADAIPTFAKYLNLIEVCGEDLILIENTQDIMDAKRQDKVGIIFGFQGLGFIHRNIEWLTIFDKLGLRICGLTYNDSNAVGYGCAEKQDYGLTYFGKKVINKLNRHGIVVDLSHAGDKTALDAVRLSQHPVVLSHSNARALCDHPRNAPDDVIKAVALSGGVIGLTQYAPMLDQGHGELPTIKTWLEHMDYVANLVGIDHVGIGSDTVTGWFDRWPAWKGYMLHYRDLVPERYLEPELEGVNTHHVQDYKNNSDLPKVTEMLLKRGYSEEDVQKVLGGELVTSL